MFHVLKILWHMYSEGTSDEKIKKQMQISWDDVVLSTRAKF